MNWPFNPTEVRNTWVSIKASGFADPVPGCIYDGTRLDGGIPLGGLGTGYLTLEGTGKIGHCSIYNDIVPPLKIFRDWLIIKSGQACLPLSTARIAYWGHFPIADLIADFAEGPLQVGIRAWSPFCVGQARRSNTPAALFEIRLDNRRADAANLELQIRMPDPPTDRPVQVKLLGEGLVEASANSGQAHMRLSLAGGETKSVRFAFAWYRPSWRDSSGEAHVHFYGTRFADADQAAAEALAAYDDDLTRILAWQNEVYQADLPDWMKDCLIQGLYSLAKNTVWIAKTRLDEWWDAENGWFTHNESHTGCPITETMVCRMHGHLPTLLFFPELEITTLDAFSHFQINDGEIPFSFGGGTSLRDPRFHCQHPLNSGQYAQMLYRLYKRTGDKACLERFYTSAKKAIRYQYSLDDDQDGLVNEQAHTLPGEFWPANQFYDIWPWWGTSAYVAGTWLATLAIGARLAEEMGDAAFADECRATLAKGLAAYEDKLWTGSYYRLYNDPANGRCNDVSLGNQLMAEWCLSLVGLEGVLPQDHVRQALATIARLNMQATAYGLVNGVTPDGQRYDAGYASGNDHGKHVFFAENLCAAMTFMYRGQKETGLEIARRIYEAVAIKSCSPWNQRCLIHAETGLPAWGDDYYSNLVVWALPAALQGRDIGSLTEAGGLADKMIRAAR